MEKVSRGRPRRAAAVEEHRSHDRRRTVALSRAGMARPGPVGRLFTSGHRRPPLPRSGYGLDRPHPRDRRPNHAMGQTHPQSSGPGPANPLLPRRRPPPTPASTTRPQPDSTPSPQSFVSQACPKTHRVSPCERAETPAERGFLAVVPMGFEPSTRCDIHLGAVDQFCCESGSSGADPTENEVEAE